MCACRCGIRVHLKGGQIRYIEGNPDHPVNKGVLCAKGSAGIMHQNSPAKLNKPLLRVGERGSGEFKEIEWDEALALATDWLGDVRERDPAKLAFFTGRDQSQSLTGWWASQFGTHNFAAHGGFCSVNMAAGGLYTLGGAFWEFGEPDYELTKYHMMIGVADDHDSNPIKMGLGHLKTREGTKFVSVNPIRTGYSAIADEWVGIRPGTDGLFIFALIHELLRAEKIDFAYLARYTNAPWLVICDEGTEDDGLFLRGADGQPIVWCLEQDRPVQANAVHRKPAFVGERRVNGRKVVPSFQLLAERYLDKEFAADAVAKRTGIPADTIRRIAAELAQTAFEEEVVIDQPWTDVWGRKHDKMVGRPVSFHAMRGVSAHSNGFHTCRAIHILQALLGSVDVPGGWRYKAPFPKPIPPGLLPAMAQPEGATPLDGPPLGFPRTPDHLLVDQAGDALRIDKAYSWEHPLALHGLMHTVLRNAAAKDPNGIDVLFMFMANMAWNSSMNIPETLECFTKRDESGEYAIPKIIYSDAFWSETVPYCDLILPDTTYLERWDCISMLDRPISSAHGGGDAIRQPVLEPDRDVRAFQTVLLDLGARLGLPGMVNEDGSPKFPGGYPDYIVNHERSPGVGPLSGWRGEDGEKSGVGSVNPDQLERYIENGSFWSEKLPEGAEYFKFANRKYLEYAKSKAWIGHCEPIIFQLYNEDLQRFRLSAKGHGDKQPPARHRKRIETYFDPLPIWYPPFLEDEQGGAEFPLHALSQRPMHMYHSWGSQNAWLRQITSANKLHIHRQLAQSYGLKDDDWVWIENALGQVKAQVKLVTGVNPNVVWTWNAIGKRKGAWGLDKDSPETTKAFLLNHIISDTLSAQDGKHAYSNSDPVTGQAAWYDLRVRLRKCDADDSCPDSGEFSPVGQRFRAPNGPSDFGASLKGRDTGGRKEIREFIGQRDANASWIEGIRRRQTNEVEDAQ